MTAATSGTKEFRSADFKSAILALSAGWVMIYADRLSISPIMNLIRQQFGLTYSEVSLVVSIYFLAYVGFTIPATITAEKFGYRKVMFLFFLLAAVSLLAAGALGYSYLLLVLLMGLHGAGAGAYYPTAYRISNATIRGERGLVSALINSGMGFGTMAGLLVAGPILNLFQNWQVMLILLSVPTFVVAVMLRGLTEEPPLNDKDNRSPLVNYRKLLENRNFVMLCCAMFCSLYGYWVILTWGPSYLQESLGLGIFFSGAVTAVFSAFAIPSSILISYYSDRAGRKRVAMIILPLAALAIFILAISSNLTYVLLAIAFYGIFGKLTLDPIVIAWVADFIGQEQLGSALALLNVAAMSSSILAPFITGLLADIFGGLATGFFLGAAVVLLGLLFVAIVQEGNGWRHGPSV
ncbi:MAG: MFS transporter [Conexivisphaerales archaeon]